MQLTFHDLRILLKAATGYDLKDEEGIDKQDLVGAGLLIRSGAGYWDVSSGVNRKFDRILSIWEEL